MIVSAIWSAFKASVFLRVAAAALAAFLGFKAWLYAHEWKVEDRAIAAVTKQIDKEAGALASKAAKARDAAVRTPDPAQRLRDRYCDGCAKP